MSTDGVSGGHVLFHVNRNFLEKPVGQKVLDPDPDIQKTSTK